MVWSAAASNAGFSAANSTWLPVKAPQASRAVDLQSENPESVLEFYREMLALRRSTQALGTGKTKFLDTDEPVLAFVRGDSVLCAFNLSAKKASHMLDVDAKPLLASGATIKNGKLTFEPNGFLIAQL